MINIFIANLDWEITSDDLKVTFTAFGDVKYAHVVYDNKTKKSKGFGYVEMEKAEEAIASIMALNGFEVNGRKLDVKIASPKGNRPEPKPAPVKKQFKKKPFNNNGPRKPWDGQKKEYTPKDHSDRPLAPRDNTIRPSVPESSDEVSSSTNSDRVMRPRRNKDSE